MPECRSCGQKIMWVKTANGKSMPIDHDLELEHLFNDGEPVEFDSQSMVSHFSTCPQAEQHRRNDSKAKVPIQFKINGMVEDYRWAVAMDDFRALCKKYNIGMELNT